MPLGLRRASNKRIPTGLFPGLDRFVEGRGRKCQVTAQGSGGGQGLGQRGTKGSLMAKMTKHLELPGNRLGSPCSHPHLQGSGHGQISNSFMKGKSRADKVLLPQGSFPTWGLCYALCP